jgi:hypothetical protein
VGFSTGALERSDFRSAIEWLIAENVPIVELSALRLSELAPLVDELDKIPINSFSYVSFHAPSAFPTESECEVVRLLDKVAEHNWNIIVHPDVIRDISLWVHFGERLLLENMDRRKKAGRTISELQWFFHKLPDARFCLDVAHARQMDTTLSLLTTLAIEFADLIAEIHISELDSFCCHQPMSNGAVSDYQLIAKDLNQDLPIIIESILDGEKAALRKHEIELACIALQGSDSPANGFGDDQKTASNL